MVVTVNIWTMYYAKILNTRSSMSRCQKNALKTQHNVSLSKECLKDTTYLMLKFIQNNSSFLFHCQNNVIKRWTFNTEIMSTPSL